MGGAISPWLYERMVRLAGPVVEVIVLNEGTNGFLSRLSDPGRFAFAYGTKNVKPLSVLTSVYDETIATLEAASSQVLKRMIMVS